ncbi:MAG: hypothetical protein ACKVZJ_11915 [Phycisphaerales bacterium]
MFSDSGTNGFRFFEPGRGAGDAVPGALPENLVDGGLAFLAPNAQGQAFVFFLAGGDADSGGPGAGRETNRLYRGTIDIDDPTPTVVQPFIEVADFSLNDISANNQPGPVMAGLGVLDERLYTAVRRFNGAPFNQGDQNSAILSIEFNRGSASGPGGANVNFLMELPGADMQTLTGAETRGSIFAAGIVNPEDATNNAYQNLAVFEIDPRVDGSPYIRNTLWGAAGDFVTNAGTTVSPDFNPTQFDRVAELGGAAFLNDRLILNAFADEGTPGGSAAARNAFFLTIDPDATDLRGPGGVTISSLTALAGGGGLGTSGMSAVQGVGQSAGLPTLDSSTGGTDFSVGTLFGRVSYSTQALQSGVLQQIYRQRFIETSIDPVFCSIDPVIGQIPGALLNNANKTRGIARTTFDLRNPLPTNHPCQAPGTP